MTEGNFTDRVTIHIRSGNGGKGSTHLRREKFVPMGGPDGGDGGRGGHIVVKANQQLWTLYHFKFNRHFYAGQGGDGGRSCSTGADGKDVYVEVPAGTVIKDPDTEQALAEILTHGQEFILAEGGKGGRGNWHFKSATNQTPRYAQPGIAGIEKKVVLELKLLADVGLVGFPNAGKSTLLSVLTSAKPKIADYEFTTLKPNLGIVKYHDFRTFVMADIPGIIEGASEGKGLGHHFLRHVERNSVLLFLVSADTADIGNTYRILLNELKRYNPELLDKERLLAISKADLLGSELEDELAKRLKKDKHLRGVPFLFISSVSERGLPQLKDLLWERLNNSQ